MTITRTGYPAQLKFAREPNSINPTKSTKGTKMTSFPLNAGEHYLKSLNVFLKKSGQRSETLKMLEERIPPLLQRSLAARSQQPSRLNIYILGRPGKKLRILH